MKVKITWATGKVEFLDRSDCDTIDQVTNSVFGSQWELAESHGVTVMEATDDEFFAAHTAEAEGQTQSDADLTDANQLQQANDAHILDQAPEAQNLTGSDVGDDKSVLGL